jgi:NADP-dependent 3-hydroxy acid dehydrogenase YdfG
VGAFSGQGAVVTGASSGVGRAIALALGEQGAAVSLVGRNLERLEATAAETPSALVCPADLTRDEDVAELAARVGEELPGLDILVHAAAIIDIAPLEAAPLDDLDSQYRTNVRAPYGLTQALLPLLRERKGQVVFLNSTAGRSAGAGSGQYAATKHALTAVADSLRAEVNADGLRVLSVFLGRTATPMQAALAETEGREYRPERLVQPEDVAALVVCALSLPRTAEVTEIAIRPMRPP